MLKIYLTDLAAYNKGFLYGEWLELPMSEQELHYKLNKILRAGEALCAIEYGYEKHEEWFITDYEWDDSELYEVDEYANIDELNQTCETLSELDKHTLKAVTFLWNQGYVNDIHEAIEKADNVNVYEDQDLEDVAYEMMQELYHVHDLSPFIANHIDYKGIARDLEIDGFVEYGGDVYEYTV